MTLTEAAAKLLDLVETDTFSRKEKLAVIEAFFKDLQNTEREACAEVCRARALQIEKSHKRLQFMPNTFPPKLSHREALRMNNQIRNRK